MLPGMTASPGLPSVQLYTYSAKPRSNSLAPSSAPRMPPQVQTRISPYAHAIRGKSVYRFAHENETLYAVIRFPVGWFGIGEPERLACHALTSSASQSGIRSSKVATGRGGLSLPPVREYERHVDEVTPQCCAQSTFLHSSRPVSASVMIGRIMLSTCGKY